MATGVNDEVKRWRLLEKIHLFDKRFFSTTKAKQSRGTVPGYSSKLNCTWDHCDWYREASPSQKVRLKNFLIEFDRQNRVDPEQNTTKDMHKDVSLIMTALTQKMEQLDCRFGGKLFWVGSSHNDTKVGEPDEFDFIYELNVCTLLGDENASTSYSFGDLQLHPLHMSENGNVFEFWEYIGDPNTLKDVKPADRNNAPKPIHSLRSLLKQKSKPYIRDMTVISLAFFVVLNDTLQQLVLPEGWSHGGFDRPSYSGVRYRFPSYVLQLQFDGRDTRQPLSVSVDFVPVLKVDNQSHPRSGILEELLDSLDPTVFASLNFAGPVRLYHTWPEERFLSDYPFHSTAKTVMRVCKLLCKEAGLSTSPYLQKDWAKTLPKYGDTTITEDPADWPIYMALKLLPGRMKFELFDDTLATGQDIGENLGIVDYVSSYIIKLSVMTFMALDPDKGKSWTSDDIVDLVVSVFLIINDILVSVKREEKPMTCYQVLSVPLERYCKKPYGPEAQVSPGAVGTPPKLYQQFRNAYNRGKCSKLWSLLMTKLQAFGRVTHPGTETRYDPRLYRVFEILQSVLERKAVAKLKVWVDDALIEKICQERKTTFGTLAKNMFLTKEDLATWK